MNGPEIIARTLAVPQIPDKFGNTWQYHSRSDRHSKVSCWAVLFDLLRASDLLQRHVRDGKVALGINRRLNDWQTGKKKDLDMVVARAPGSASQSGGEAVDLQAMAQRYRIILTDEERAELEALPASPAGVAGATVLVALEAKACMTAHVKALPRLYDELASSHSIVHGDNPNALSVGFVMVNAADRFVSPDLNRRPIAADAPAVVSEHNQPRATERTLNQIQDIRRRPGPGSGAQGFDALGALVVTMVNDGSPVTVMTDPPAPEPSNQYHYEQMVSRAAHLYDSTFGHVS